MQARERREVLGWRAATERAVDLRWTARPLLWGAAEGGDAWEDYRVAVDGMPEDMHSGDVAAFRQASKQAERDAFLAPLRPSLTAIRRGARRGEVRGTFRWTDGYWAGWRKFHAVMGLAQLASVEAARQLGAGDDVDAARWLLAGGILTVSRGMHDTERRRPAPLTVARRSQTGNADSR